MNGATSDDAPKDELSTTQLILQKIRAANGQAEEKPATEDAEPEPESEQGESEDSDEWDFDRSELAALKRDGMSESMIRRLGMDDALRLGKKRVKVQRDYQKAFGSRAPEDDAGSGYQAEPIDLTAAVKPLGSTLGLSDEESQELAKHLPGVIDAAVSKRMERLESALLSVMQREEGTAWSAARAELVERIPGLSDDSTFEEDIKPLALKLARSGIADEAVGLDRVRILIEAASKLHFDNIPSRAEVERRQKLSNLRKTSANVSKRSPTHKAITDPLERIKEGIRLQRAGKSLEEIKSHLG